MSEEQEKEYRERALYSLWEKILESFVVVDGEMVFNRKTLIDKDGKALIL